MARSSGDTIDRPEAGRPERREPTPRTKTPGRRVANILALLVFVAAVVATLLLRLPDLERFLAEPGSATLGATGAGLGRFLPVATLGLVSLICILGTRRMIRYRGVGRLMGAFAAVGAAADLAGSIAGHEPVPWLLQATVLKWALTPVPVLFALGILISRASRAFRQPPSEKIDARAVREGLTWANDQVTIEQQKRCEQLEKQGRRMPDSKLGRRLLPVWDWVVARPPPPPERHPRAAPATDRTGVCFSGGGIRSAAFNLGALQELQAAGELQRAHYLSAVSGGSYMAGAYALTAACSDPAALASAPPFASGTPEEQYLRNRTTYLVPNLQGFGVVLWRLVRGLAVNIAFVGLVVYLVARPYGWLMHWRFQALCPDGPGPCRPAFFQEPGLAGAVLLGLVGLALAVGLLDLMLRPQGAVSSATEAWSLRLAALGVIVAVAVFLLPWAAVRILAADVGVAGAGTALKDIPAKAAGFGALSTLATGFLALASRSGTKGSVRKRASSASKLMARARDGARKVGDGTLRILLIVVGGVIGPVAFLAGILAAAMGAIVWGIDAEGFTVWLLLLTVFVLVEWVSDANRWSLQPFYKRRLQTAFGLVREREEGQDGQMRASEIDFNTRLSFTNLLDVPELVVCAAVNLEDYGLLPPGRPVSTFTFSREQIDAGILGQVPTRTFGALLGPEYARDFTVPAAQGASGAAFSPAMGKLTNYSARFVFALLNLRLGVWLPNPRHVARWAAKQPSASVPKAPAQETAALEAAHDQALQALTEARHNAESERRACLDLAEGLKGESLKNHLAKVSRLEAGLQAKVFAAQLEAERCRRAIDDATHPLVPVDQGEFTGFPYFPRPTRLFRELFGRFRSTSRFVYVTDGGHYECLGLLELLRRGCKWIYCFDASGDKTDAFNTIGDAVAIARAELGVRIELDPAKLAPRGRDGFNQGLYTVGKVRYPGNEEHPAHIVFVKLGLTEDVPADVLAWHQANPRFPADGTGDQLYTDQRFEAYRALGAFSTDGAIKAMRKLRGDDPLGAPGPLRPPAPMTTPVAAPVTAPDLPPVTTNSRA